MDANPPPRMVLQILPDVRFLRVGNERFACAAYNAIQKYIGQCEAPFARQIAACKCNSSHNVIVSSGYPNFASLGDLFFLCAKPAPGSNGIQMFDLQMRKGLRIRFVNNLIRQYQTDLPAIPGELPKEIILQSLRNLLTNIGGTLMADAETGSDTSYEESIHESDAAETIIDDYVADDESDPGTANRIPSGNDSEGDYYPPLDVCESDEEMDHLETAPTSAIVRNHTQTDHEDRESEALSDVITNVSDVDVEEDMEDDMDSDWEWEWDSDVEEDINDYHGLGDNKRNPIVIN